MIPLNKSEIRELRGLQARQREIEKEIIAPLQEDFKAFLDEVQLTHGIELGKTHALNAQTFVLEEIPAKEENETLEE